MMMIMAIVMMIPVTGGSEQPSTCDMDQRSPFLIIFIIIAIIIIIIVIMVIIIIIILIIIIPETTISSPGGLSL